MELQEWLLNDLIKREQPGQYYLRKIGLKDKDFVSRIGPGSLILFRKGEYIVGEGISATGIQKLNSPLDGKYYNEIFVEPQSVRTYQLPIQDIVNWCRREDFPTNITNSDIQTGRYYLIVGRRDSFENEFAGRFPDRDNGCWATGEDIASNFPPDVNSIPGQNTNKCYPTLMVGIGSLDNVETRIMEAAYHVNVSCLGKNKQVVFEVAKWDSELWRKHAKKFINVKVILIIKGARGEMEL